MIKVGETFEQDGKNYEVRNIIDETDSCKGCYFDNNEGCIEAPRCSGIFHSIIFVEVKKMITGQQLKQDGQQKVLSNHSAEFKAAMVDKLKSFCRTNKNIGINEFRMEHFRKFCERDNLMPNHPNFWGGFVGIAVKEGLIKSTGKYEKAVSPKTHHHPVMVYKII